LKDLCFPHSPASRDFNELKHHLFNFYAPKKLTVAERYRFHNSKQTPGQSVSEFAQHLKKLASSCDFGQDLQSNLRDRFICGLLSENLKRKLLSEELTFQTALDRAVADETASKNVRDIVTSPTHTDSTAHVASTRKGHNAPVSQQQSHRSRNKHVYPPCARCGFTNHAYEKCRYKNAKCYQCGEIGHLKSECKNTLNKSQKARKGKKVKHVDENVVQGFSDEDEETVFKIKNKKAGELCVDVKVFDKIVEMEVDSGSSSTLINDHDFRKLFPHLELSHTPRELKAYSGYHLNTMGEVMVEVSLNGRTAKLPLIVVQTAEHSPPLLGRTWLDALVPGWRTSLMNNVEKQFAVTDETIDTLKDKYQDIFAPGLGTVKGATAKLHLKENVKPIFHRARPVPLALRNAVDKELDRMLEEEIIKPVDISEWATPLVCVPKADGSVRLCGDYKVTVNKCILTDQHPIPTPEEILAKISGGQKFSKIDLKNAYQQLILEEESQKIVTINTSRGLFQYTRLPFGTSSSPAIWQRFIDQVLQGLDWVCVIQDDVLVSGRNDAEHLQNLETVFQRFLKFGLRVKPEKCRFLQEEVEFFSLKISKGGIKPTHEKIRAVRDAPTPKNVTELRSWLGMLNFHAKFLPNISTVLHPLHDLLGKKEWNFTKKCEEAFEKAKQMLLEAPMLIHYNPNQPLFLAVDASPYGLGAVILHRHTGKLRPIAYASRTLNDHEKNYGQIDKEAAAIMFGVQRFKSYLYGRHFTIMSDHKPLEFIFGKKKGIPTLAAQRLQRWAITLAAFDYDIEYIPAKENVLADALSRLPLPETGSLENKIFMVEEKWLDNLPVSSKDVRQATSKDRVLARVLDYTRNGWPASVDDMRLKPFFEKRHEISIEADCLLWGLRVIVPEVYHERILEELHCAHPGMVRMKELARSYVWWPRIDYAIEQMVRGCAGCQKTKTLPSVAPTMPWVWPSAPWVRIHIDFAEKDGRHYLIIMDAHSKWPEVFPMRSTSAAPTITVLRETFTRFGLPHQVVSDNGPPFRSAEFEHFLRNNGVKHIFSSPYHPASNGAAERFVRSFKQALSSSGNDEYSISQQIARFLFTYRTTPHATTGVTPSHLMFGRELRTRLSIIKPSTSDNVRMKQSTMLLRNRVFREFFPGDQVQVKDMRNDTWWNGTIAERKAPKTYIVVLRDGRVWTRHVDCIRSNVQEEHATEDDKDLYKEMPSVQLGNQDIHNGLNEQDIVTWVPT